MDSHPVLSAIMVTSKEVQGEYVAEQVDLLDRATGRVVSQSWNNLDQNLKDELSGLLKVASVMPGGKALSVSKPIRRGNPLNGPANEWVEHPYGKQDRLYDNNGKPAVDIDYGHDHGQGSPHAHNWENGIREPGIPVSKIKKQ